MELRAAAVMAGQQMAVDVQAGWSSFLVSNPAAWTAWQGCSCTCCAAA
jgi:hypothetical protein